MSGNASFDNLGGPPLTEQQVTDWEAITENDLRLQQIGDLLGPIASNPTGVGTGKPNIGIFLHHHGSMTSQQQLAGDTWTFGDRLYRSVFDITQDAGAAPQRLEIITNRARYGDLCGYAVAERTGDGNKFPLAAPYVEVPYVKERTIDFNDTSLALGLYPGGTYKQVCIAKWRAARPFSDNGGLTIQWSGLSGADTISIGDGTGTNQQFLAPITLAALAAAYPGAGKFHPLTLVADSVLADKVCVRIAGGNQDAAGKLWIRMEPGAAL